MNPRDKFKIVCDVAKVIADKFFAPEPISYRTVQDIMGEDEFYIEFVGIDINKKNVVAKHPRIEFMQNYDGEDVDYGVYIHPIQIPTASLSKKIRMFVYELTGEEFYNYHVSGTYRFFKFSSLLANSIHIKNYLNTPQGLAEII